jgi:polar amino acid transport system permease protein
MFNLSFALSILPKLAAAAAVTLYVTMLSFFLAFIIGMPLAVMRRAKWPAISRSTAVVDFIRGTPVLVQLFFLYLALPTLGIRLSPMATGLIAFSVHYGCYMSEIYRAGLEGVARGQWDASVALNISRFEAYRSIVLPQAVQPVILAAGNYLVHMFKETPLLSSISVIEMMFVAADIGAETFRYLEPITVCGLLFLIMSLGAAGLIRLAERLYGRHWGRAWN